MRSRDGNDSGAVWLSGPFLGVVAPAKFMAVTAKVAAASEAATTGSKMAIRCALSVRGTMAAAAAHTSCFEPPPRRRRRPY